MLIILEGLDNSGKNTIVTRLCQRHSSYIKIDFPDYSSNIGKLIKEELTQGALAPLPLQLLFSCERLSKKQLVVDWSSHHALITTRYSYSAIAYGTARGISESLLRELEAEMPTPDLKIFLDITPRESIRRSQERDIFESDYTLLQRVYDIYQHIIHEENDWVVINAMQPIEVVEKQVEQAIFLLLDKP